MIQKYRCISLWEPWGSLIAQGKKTIECRPKRTNVRGDVLICCAVKQDKLIKGFVEAYKEAGLLDRGFEPAFGYAVALAEIYDCKPLTSADIKRAALLGENLDFGGWGWHLRNIRPLIEPECVLGKQGFFFRLLDLEGKLQTALPTEILP